MQITKEKLNEVEGELRNTARKMDPFCYKELEDAISASTMEDIVNGAAEGWEAGQEVIGKTLAQLNMGEKLAEMRSGSLKLVLRHILAIGIKAGIALSEAEQLHNMMGRE